MLTIEIESNSMIIDNFHQLQIFKCMTTDLVDQWYIFRMLLKSQWLLLHHLLTYITLDKGFNNQMSPYWVCLEMKKCHQWSIGNKAPGYHLGAIRLLKTTSQEIRQSDISSRVNMGNDLDLGQMLSLAKVHHLALINASILLVSQVWSFDQILVRGRESRNFKLCSQTVWTIGNLSEWKAKNTKCIMSRFQKLKTVGTSMALSMPRNQRALTSSRE